MRIFKDNEFFRGLSIPEPDGVETMDAKMPKAFPREGVDFLKVRLKVSKECVCLCL